MSSLCLLWKGPVSSVLGFQPCPGCFQLWLSLPARDSGRLDPWCEGEAGGPDPWV